MSRLEQLRANLSLVTERVARACERAARDPHEVTLVVVTKFFPASDVRLLHELGVRHVGESRQQEASGKRHDCAELDLTWHFVGRLQSNKAAAVAEACDVVHSVDRVKLLGPLSSGVHRRGGDRPLDVLVQVGLDEPRASVGRSGVSPEGALELARQVRQTEGLRLRGVMGVAPLGRDPRPAFEVLAQVGRRVVALDPGAGWVSAGMSGDLEAAVAAGATHVRVGSAILGKREGRR